MLRLLGLAIVIGILGALAVLAFHQLLSLLELTLNEEKAADALLSTIAEDEVNPSAPGMLSESDEEGDDAVAAQTTHKKSPSRRT